jgi:thiamine-monophosphate kinase
MAAMRENGLIERIRELAAPGRAGRGGRVAVGAAGARMLRILQGIGDDSAVLGLSKSHRGRLRRGASRGGFDLLVTTDFSLENVHFRRAWHPPESAGHRCLARGLSDIAAMGGEPAAAFLSLALPRGTSQTWVEWFLRGLLALAGRHKVVLAGGDIARSPRGVLADIVVLGTVPAGTALLRSGARPGDHIYVTGSLGRAAAALQRLSRSRKKGVARPGQPVSASQAPQLFPQPRVEVGRRLRAGGLASAAIDLSDGLSTDLGHICAESGVGAVIYEASLPLFTREAALGFSDKQALELALHGGEDYELLFTAPHRQRVPGRIAGVKVTRVGEVVAGRRVWSQDAAGKRRALKAAGWEHVIA